MLFQQSEAEPEEDISYKDNPNYCESRLDFPKLIDEYGWKIGIEVGTYSGEYSEYLLESSKLEKLYSVDKWRDHMGDSQFYPPLEAKVECRKRLRKFGKRSVMQQKESLEASWDFENQHFDFIYLDAGHDSVNFMHDLGTWYKKTKIGGFFGGHDYMVMPYEGATVVFLTDIFAGLVGQRLYVTGARNHTPQERHKVACVTASKFLEKGEEDKFDHPSWYIIRNG